MSALDAQIGSRSALDLTYNRAWPAPATCTRMTVLPGSLSELKEIGCKSACTVYISPLFLINRMTIDLQNRQSLSAPQPNFCFDALSQTSSWPIYISSNVLQCIARNYPNRTTGKEIHA